MSCEIRSMMTSYFFGSSIRTPPIFTNSAVTPSAFMPLIFSTSAGGNVFSIPKRIPIFLATAISCLGAPLINVILSGVSAARSAALAQSKDPYTLIRLRNRRKAFSPHCHQPRERLPPSDWRLKVLSRHPLPQRPIMLAVVPVDIQPMRNPLATQNRRHLYVRVQTHIPIRRSQYDLHLPDAAQEPLIAHVRQIVRRVVEINVVVVVAIELALDVERSAHADASRHHIRMPHGKIQCMIAAKAAPRHRDLRSPVLPLQVR